MIFYIILGICLLGLASGLVGSFTFLRKRALIGDSIAHSVFPGVAIGFLVSQSKDPIFLILGACLTGFLSIVVVDLIVRKSKLKTDTAIALVLSVFFGFGVLLFTYIQHEYQSAQTGLDKFLFGKAASMLKSDLYWLAGVSAFVILSVILFYKEFLIISFDRNYAKSTGISVRFYENMLSLLTILVIVVGIQIVGIVLMAALLVTPSSSARFWTERLKSMLVLSSVFAMLSGVLGVLISLSFEKMPTGPWIVICLSVFAVGSILFAPNSGLYARILKRKRIQNQMNEDNILKTFYHLGEKDSHFSGAYSRVDLLDRRFFNGESLTKGLKDLVKSKDLIQENSKFKLSDNGLKRSKRIVKLHRLWEMYLSQKLKLKHDHVHDDADTIEHFITEELEAELEKILDYPTEDPHQTKIPYA
ncbi:MAG: iron chelate uptake ABC transporter family permease subunit [Flavobacteriales bacterium]